MGKQCRIIHLIMESLRVAVLVFSLVLFCSVASRGLEVRSNDDPATPCTDANCKLPDCFCSGTKAPNDIPGERVPQFIMLTFDDSINPYVHQFYEKLFNPARKNPNGCPIRGTFYVTHEWNDYWLTKKLYNEGHEIADHSVTHESTDVFKTADIDRWVKEICGMKKTLEIFAGVKKDDVRGFRAPYLQSGGDVMFEAMAKCGVTYDTSLPASENKPPLWPYTLDYKSEQQCKIEPCPKKSHPGMWEVPMVYYDDEQSPPRHCAMIDACHDNGTKESAFNLLLKNFLRHYLTNRAPFPMFMHAGWFTVNPHRWAALNEFIDLALSRPDVYFVTATDVIDWMKNPVMCEIDLKPRDAGEYSGSGGVETIPCQLPSMKDWTCINKEGRRVVKDEKSGATNGKEGRPSVCEESEKKSCVLDRNVHNGTHERRFSTCLRCPNTYPWLGNPDGNLMEDMGLEVIPEERSYFSPPRGVHLTKPKPVVEAEKTLDKKALRAKLFARLQLALSDKSNDQRILAKVLGDSGK